MTREEAIQLFNDRFKVTADSMAQQTVTFTSDGEYLNYDETEVYGETAVLSLRDRETKHVLYELNDLGDVFLIDDYDLLNQWIDHIIRLNGDLDAFIKELEQ